MVGIILAFIWTVLLLAIIVVSVKLWAVLYSSKLMVALKDAEHIGGADFQSNYPAFVNRYKMIRRGAKHIKLFDLQKHAPRFQREFGIMEESLAKMKLHMFSSAEDDTDASKRASQKKNS